MEDKRFELNILSYCVVAFNWILSIWGIVFIVGDSLGQLDFAKYGLPITLLLGALLFPALITTWGIIVQKTTSYSASGISRLTVFGRKHMAWTDAKFVSKNLSFLEIEFSTGKCQIALLMHKDPQAIVEYVKSQVAAHLND